MKTFAELRKSRGYTLSYIANKCGLSVVFIGEIERGKKSGSISTVQKLAKCFDLPADEMIQLIMASKLARG